MRSTFEALAAHGATAWWRYPLAFRLALVLAVAGFRDYITQALLLVLGRSLAAAVASGILFGALHIPNGVPQAANALVLSVALSLIAVRTGSLAFGWGLHLVNNMFGAVVVVSASDVFHGSPGLFTQTAPQLLWWDVVAACVATVLLTLLVLRRPALAPGAY